MESLRKNKSLYIDQEAISALGLLKANLLYPVTSLMNRSQTVEVLENSVIDGKTFPFPFILAPAGEQNHDVLSFSKKGEKLDLISHNNEIIGYLIIEETFEINPRERIRQIYGTDDFSQPGVQETFNRVGKIAVCGEFELFNDKTKDKINLIKDAQKRIGAKHTTAFMMAANPLHRAHERIVRQSLDKTDLVVIFLLKPYNANDLNFNLRYKTLNYFVENFLPTNRVIIIPLENSYIFAGYNEVLLDAIVAKNFGCDKLTIGQNHAGVGMHYDTNANNKSILDKLIGINMLK